MSVFVVVWHFAGAGRTLLFEEGFRAHQFGVSDFVNFHLLLLAVPTFVLISNFLLVRARPAPPLVARRALRIGVLLLFWPPLLLIFQGGWAGFWAGVPGDLDGWPLYLLTAGDTIYYFFVALVLTYGLSFQAARLPTAANLVLFVLALLAVGLAPLVSMKYDWPGLCAFWSPLNFLPYPFAGVLVLRLCDRGTSVARALGLAAILALCASAVAVLEWRAFPDAVFFAGQYVNFPTYTRASLVLLAIAIFVLALRVDRPAPVAVAFMARHALALYCLHMFVVSPMRLLAERIGGSLPEMAQAWLLIALTVGASYLAAKALSLVWKDRLLY